MSTCTRSIRRRNHGMPKSRMVTCGSPATTFNAVTFNGEVLDLPVCNVHREGLPQLLDVRPELADFGRGFVHALGVAAA